MRTPKLAAILLISVVPSQGLVHAGEPDRTAEEILRLSGIAAGLCVHLECGDGRLLAELGRNGRFLAHGVSTDAAAAAAARKRLAGEGLAGLAGAEVLPLDRLPYADNLVNLLIADDLPALIAKGLKPREILRVLCPEGTACLGVAPAKRKQIEAQMGEAGIRNVRFEQKSRLWLVLTKPRPAGMDDWTHWNHGADGNRVSHDLLTERPNQIQWIAGQHWGSPRIEGVPGAGSALGVRSANGRNYYILGGGPFAGSGHHLVGRDAFNGVMLWTRGIEKLADRLVVASGDEVYLCREGEIVALDGATGEQVRSYGKADGCRHLLLAQGVLLSFEAKRLIAYDAATGKEEWSTPKGGSAGSPVVGRGNVFFTRSGELVCMDLPTGAMKWTKRGRAGIAFAFGDMVLLCEGTKGTKTKYGLRYAALSPKDGAEVWTYTCDRPKGGKGKGVASDAYLAGGLIWILSHHDRSKRKTDGFHNPKGGTSYQWQGLDPKTGAVRRSFLAPVQLMYHCHPLFATDRFFIGNRPIYFTDWKTGKVTRFEATRLACQSNCGLGQGLFFGLYSDSPMCMCIRHAMSGVSAYTSDGRTIDGQVKTREQGRLVKGPAAAPTSPPAPAASNWPMYRHDMRRSAGAPGRIPREMTVVWARKLLPASGGDNPLRSDWLLHKVSGDAVTQPTVAEGKVFVSLTHAGQVVALDAKSSKVAWRFLAPARLDAPPTVHKGLCLIGCNNGWVYCLRSDDGREVWRFRAAPAERRIVAYGQTESAWPVVGGPLLVGDVAYVLAGRTTESDGGLYVHALEPATGKCLWTQRRVKPDDGPIGAWNLRGLKDDYFGPADVLSADGETVAIAGHRRGRFNPKTGARVSGASPRARFGWMQSWYALDNQRTEYPPRASSGKLDVAPLRVKDRKTKTVRYAIAAGGKVRWRTQPTQGLYIEALAVAGEVSGIATSPRPIARVKAVDGALKIDGRIDELYTRSATPLRFSFLDARKAKPKEATTAYVLCDKENLYLAVRCEKPDPDRVVCKKTKRDDGVWQDECVEIFLDPKNTRKAPYFHIVVNPAGVTEESYGGKKSWNPEMEVKCGKESGKAWIAEVRIPLRQLNLKPGSIGHVWSINLNRSARDPNDPQSCEDTAWSPTGGSSSHVPEMFGHMWLDAFRGDHGEAEFAAWRKKLEHAAKPAETVTPRAEPDGVVAVLAAVSRQEPGGTRGELWVLSAKDGSRLATHKLPAAPAFDGVSVAGGKVYVVLQDGTVMCLGAKARRRGK